jgi:hypothetical protein
MPGERFRGALVGLLLTAALVSACSKGNTNEPSDTPSNVNGTWSGAASDSSGSGTMTWTLTQSGSSVTGTLSMSDPGNASSGTGTLTGSVAGNTFTFALTVPPGGFTGAYITCSASLSGTGTVSASAISGSYTGNNSCTGTVGAGQMTLNKQ